MSKSVTELRLFDEEDDPELEEARDRIIKARTTLIRDHPWFGNLSLRLRTRPTYIVTPTMATDGTDMLWNPEWVKQQDDDVLLFACAHEVQHVALLHPYRIGDRDITIANIAADFIVNEWLERAGFVLPKWALRDLRFDGMYFEQVYALLEDDITKFLAGSCTCDQGGEILPAPTDDEGTQEAPTSNGDDEQEQQPVQGRMTAADWEIAVEEASMLARKAGNMPAGIDAYIRKARESTEDWRARLRQFMDFFMPHDYSWATPNRTYLGHGYILPGTRKESMPRLGIAVDTSGSIFQQLLDVFGEEVQAIIRECRPECVEVVYCDTAVNNVEEFLPDDEIQLHPRGRGGTFFGPALRHFEQNPPAAALYFTDTYNYGEVLEQPDYPVLWVVPDTVGPVKMPFGEVIVISAH